jgi:uncharacterized protein (TIGR03790 family)
MRRSTLLGVGIKAVAALGWCGFASAIPPAERTADLPDSWLVLYNINSSESVAWVDWYQQQRNIPADHLLGIACTLQEDLADLTAVQAEVIGPVRTFLVANPEVAETIMGIVLGYGLPGHYGTPPINPSVGGFSVADALQDMTDDTLPPGPFDYQGGQRGYNYDCPTLSGRLLPASGRLTKATMAANRYMVMRIDGPTVEAAQALTLRAKVLENPQHSLQGESVSYDYYDPAFPSSNHEWYWLKSAVAAAALADLPWASFESHAGAPAHDAFRMAIYKVTGWSAADFEGPDVGSRVLGFDYNSYGAVTLRSPTAQGGLYVPNALAAGYAAAIGATGEPQCCQSPIPGVLLAALREGWTLGEAAYLTNPFNDWMWTAVGDPFLRLPNWFNAPPELGGDINADGMVNLQDLAGFRACLGGPGVASDPVCLPYDFDNDGDYDLLDFAGLQQTYTGGDVTPPDGDFDTNGLIDLADLAGLVSCQTSVTPTAAAAGCAVFDFDFDLDIDMRDFSHLEAWLWPVPLSGADCNSNGTDDALEIARGTSADCNLNGTPDGCDIALGPSGDCNTNAVPDECEADCNGNLIPDDCDVAADPAADCNTNAVPDECEDAGDCNGNGVPDVCDILAGTSADCNGNRIPDVCELAAGTGADCNTNGVPDACDILAGTSADCNVNGTPDECESSLNGSTNGLRASHGVDAEARPAVWRARPGFRREPSSWRVTA